ncbi:MAG: hypothetical protein IJ268_02065, partial [Proteobacteria bacterium]|nr:hypothetical protein [Pseudomonadota bacterium]
KSEISVAPATMTFDADNWNSLQTITVTGVDDVVVDGDIVSEVMLKADSEDKNYGGDGAELLALEDKIEMTTLDNDKAAILVVAEGAEIFEDSGKNIELKVLLAAQPDSQVSVFAKSTDVTELKLISQPTMIFTEENWNVPQTVILQVQDDNYADGMQTVFVDFSSSSEDPLFNELTAKSPAYNVLDNESASVTLTAAKTEFKPGEGTTTTVRVALSALPESDVPVKLNTSDANAVKFSKTDLVFTTENWNTPQEVTMTTNAAAAPSNKSVTKIDALASGTGSYKSLKSNVVDVTTYAFLSQSFAYTGNVQSLALLPGRYKLEVWGASGGYGWEITRGGYGGYAQGTYNLASAGTMYVVVGGQGVVGAGGYNGGGATGHPGGGGASHIALNNNKGELKNYVSCQGDVLIVAGGGGGSERCLGGAGGGVTGGNGDVAGCTSGYAAYTTSTAIGGSQTAGGAAGVNNQGTAGAGSFGQGGDGNSRTTGDPGPGGGGGWYGGGGMPYYGGGGGGSGHLGTGVTGSMTNGVQNGNGSAKITFVE